MYVSPETMLRTKPGKVSVYWADSGKYYINVEYKGGVTTGPAQDDGYTWSLIKPLADAGKIAIGPYIPFKKHPIYGTASADKLIGTKASEVLWGGIGRDTLTGGAGKDAFYFDQKPTKNNVDTITDFNPKDDTIWLDQGIFLAFGKKGSIAASAFWKGTKAHDASDRLIYDKANGALYYDPDGKGGAPQVKIAQLDKNLALTAKDFLIV